MGEPIFIEPFYIPWVVIETTCLSYKLAGYQSPIAFMSDCRISLSDTVACRSGEANI